MFATNLRCITCGKQHPIEIYYNCTECGGILDVEYDLKRLIESVNIKNIMRRQLTSIWKYKELLPIVDSRNIVSLGEGGTRLKKCEKLGKKLGLNELYIKDETRNPTGSFKDRATAVAISKAKELMVKKVVTASSGNAGTSLSAYAAEAEINCVVFTPPSASEEKMIQIMIYGAELVVVEGNYSNAFNLAKLAAQEYGWFNLTSTFLNPYATEGDKTFAFELCEQLDWEVPHWVLIPISTGPLLVGSWKGFKEFNELDLIKGSPRMVGVQAKGCAPITKAFREQKTEVETWGEPKTIAQSIADPLQGYSHDGTLTLKTIRGSNGLATACSDEEILDAVKLLAKKEAVFAEPAGALPIAALKNLTSQGIVDKDDIIVCAITGHGLKDVKAVAGLCERRSKIKPNKNGLRCIMP